MHHLRTALFLLLIAGPSICCWALTLAEAKPQELVGETMSGYLTAIKQDPETMTFVQKINEHRRQEYQEVAKRTGTSITVVEQLAGQRLIENAKSGEWVQGINQQWRQK